MAKYAWIVTQDYLAGTIDPGSSRVGTIGPRDATPEQVDRLREGRIGDAWLTKDDDGEKVYAGRIIGDFEGFEPLDDFAEPDAGATAIFYKGASGAWEQL